jgi:hypothetical protein
MRPVTPSARLLLIHRLAGHPTIDDLVPPAHIERTGEGHAIMDERVAPGFRRDATSARSPHIRAVVPPANTVVRRSILDSGAGIAMSLTVPVWPGAASIA